MSLFLPAHKKTYFDSKPLKKKLKKRRKKKPKKLEEIVRQKTMLASPELRPDLSPVSTDIENPVVKELPQIEKPLQQSHPDASTYYDNLLMFNISEPKPKSLSMVGKNAKLGYVEKYRYFSSFQKINEGSSERPSPMLKYLQKIDEKKLSPVPMGMIKRKGNIKDVEIGNYSMGDSYAEALSEGINLLSPVKLQLNDNRLTDFGIDKILSNLSYDSLLDLNLSNNRINHQNLFSLESILTNKTCILQSLKLEGLNLRDLGCKIICRALKKNKTLLELNLAKNNIEGNKTLSSYISQTSTLQKLDLHWNIIRGEGAFSLCSALCENFSLRVIDLSWNSLVSPPELKSISKLTEALSSHKNLIHVDICHNSLSLEDSESISKGLMENHTILGIHMTGNHTSVSELGFLQPETENRPMSALKFRRILGFSRINSMQSWRAVCNCWICERWSPVTFQWTGEKNEPVYVHLGFEDYEGDLLEPPDYTITRMCPPGKFYYIFTVNGAVKLLDKNIENVQPVSKNVEISKNNLVLLEFSQANVIQNNLKGPDLLSIQKELVPLPRLPHKKYLPFIAKKVWNIADSIFKDYKLDSAELLGKCFEYDWSKCKVPKLIKDITELERVKSVISSKYQVLKEIYKYYSSISPAGEIWSIGQMVFTDVCNEARIIDNNFRLADIDFHLKGALFQEVRNPRSPPNSLVRFQFMEILVRIALDKYFKTGICQSQSQAVSMILENHIVQRLGHVSAQKWRVDRYFYASVEKVLKANMVLLKSLYSQFSVRKVKPGQKGFMCLDEFNDIVIKSEILNDNFTAREIGVAFNLSMMTQIQELDTDRQYQMSFIEFLEAISRVGDMVGGDSRPLDQNLQDLFPKLLWLLPLNAQREVARSQLSNN